jgi:putative endopeptidase
MALQLQKRKDPRAKEPTLIVLAVILTMGLLACSVTPPTPKAIDGATPTKGSRALDPKHVDQTANPCEDFFQYANGDWLARNPIPADRSWNGSIQEVEEHNLNLLRQILEEAHDDSQTPKGSLMQKVGDFYYTAMDEAKAEADGITPLTEEFNRIAAIKGREDLAAVIGRLHSYGVDAAFTFYIDQDAKNSSQYLAQLSQGGLGLPDRDFYLNKEGETKELRKKYLLHVSRMFELLGDQSSSATAEAQAVMDMETRLAKVSMTQVQRREPEAVYHKMTLAMLTSHAPGFSWNRYFQGIELTNPSAFNVAQPEFFKELSKMMAAVSISDWKTYLRWKLIHATAPKLNSSLVNENHHFNGSILEGINQQPPRWKRSIEATDKALGEVLGQLYVARAFSPEAKARVKGMVENLKAAFREKILSLDWMSEATKKQALKKLDTLNFKIGYPDQWRDYSSLTIRRNSYVENYLQASLFEFRRNLSKLGKPVDRSEWDYITPVTVDAYYNPNKNEMVFPAGILQPPLFDPFLDDAVNYGATGATIGHEIVHAFDDEGRKYDAEGNLKNWWAPEDEKNFKARAAMLEKQFSNYIAVDNIHINGKLTLGENIADLGGLVVAYLAFEKSLQGQPRPPKIDGQTPEQRFFLGYAESYRVALRPELLRRVLMSDPHSPPRYRVNGAVSNMPEFFSAFGCQRDKGERLGVSHIRLW